MVKTIIICDTCGKELKLTGPYFIAKNEMYKEGWKNQKINNKWTIKCNECKD